MSIFSPYTFLHSGKVAKNRLVLAAMTNLQSQADGTLGNDEFNWLISRAKAGFGIIITCAAYVNPDGQGWKNELGISDLKHAAGLSKLAKGIKAEGSLAIVQIFHGGARSPKEITGKQPWSASAHSMQLGQQVIDVREGTEAEIQQTILDFENAAQMAFEAGFDGVEIHGAHGYLLHQFLSTHTNQRSDMWGSTFDNRSRLLKTILINIKAALPPTFLVGVRLSPEDKYTYKGIDFDESLTLAQELASLGADYISVSPWDAFKKPEKYPDGEKTIIELFKECLPAEVPMMIAGEIWTAADAEKAMELGSEFMAIGKAAIANSNWPDAIKDQDYQPAKPPYTSQQLAQAGLGPGFIDYLKLRPGFVVDA